MMGSRDLERWSSLVRGQHPVHRPTCLPSYHPGNMFMFYIAGHEVRVLLLTDSVG